MKLCRILPIPGLVASYFNILENFHSICCLFYNLQNVHICFKRIRGRLYETYFTVKLTMSEEQLVFISKVSQ